MCGGTSVVLFIFFINYNLLLKIEEKNSKKRFHRKWTDSCTETNSRITFKDLHHFSFYVYSFNDSEQHNLNKEFLKYFDFRFIDRKK